MRDTGTEEDTLQGAPGVTEGGGRESLAKKGHKGYWMGLVIGEERNDDTGT